MALFFADLVRELSLGAGMGDLALVGAPPGHRRFADTVPEGASFHDGIAGVTHPDEWETGVGEIVGGALLRAPLASSQDDEAVDFSPGGKTVALTVGAAWFADQDEAGAVTIAGTASRAVFGAATVTPAQLARKVKALIDDPRAHGLIGRRRCSDARSPPARSARPAFPC